MADASFFPSQLLQIKAIKLSPQNPFTWASGMKSPIYCDNRMVLSHHSLRNKISLQLLMLGKEFGHYDYIAGVATAGIAHAAIMAHVAGKPMIYVRSKAKAHGRQNQIEGSIEEGAKVILVEDLISTGGSVIRAAEALNSVGIEVLGAVAIFTYQLQIAQDNLEEAGLKVKTITNYTDLIQVAANTEQINSSDLELLKAWKEDPANWMQSS